MQERAVVSNPEPDVGDYWVSALVRPRAGHAIDEVQPILEKKGASVREIVPGVLTFHGYESVLREAEPIADIYVNVNHRLYPDFF